MSDTPGWNAPDPGQQQAPPNMPPAQQGWGAPQPPPAWSAPKPGVIPLRPLGLGEILDGAISTMRRHPRVMLGVAAIVSIIPALGMLPFTVWTIEDMGRLQTELMTGTEPTSEDIAAVMIPGVTSIGIAVVIGILARTFLAGFLTSVVGKAVIGKPAGFREVWVDIKPSLLRLLGLSFVIPLAAAAYVLIAFLLTAVAPPLGILVFIAGIPLGFWLAVLFSLATPALVLEQGRVIQSLRRSFELVRGSWWRVFGIILLAGIIVGIIALIISLPFELAGGGFNITGEAIEVTTTYLVLISIGTIIASTITEPFLASVISLLYIDQRMRREGLDIELARAASTTQQ